MAVTHRRIPQLSQQDVDRFNKYVNVCEAKSCWNWNGHGIGGYGRIRIAGLMILTHRVAYFIATGKDPGEMKVCHTCDNPKCCNPSHLFLGTQVDNVADCIRKGRLRRSSGDRHMSKTHPETLRRGENHPDAKVTESDVREIRAIPYKHGLYQQLSHQYGINPSAIKAIRDRKTWKHVT
jgi:hypothetical protein